MPEKVTDPDAIAALNQGELEEQMRFRGNGQIIVPQFPDNPEDNFPYRFVLTASGAKGFAEVTTTDENRRTALLNVVLLHDQVEALLQEE